MGLKIRLLQRKKINTHFNKMYTPNQKYDLQMEIRTEQTIVGTVLNLIRRGQED